MIGRLLLTVSLLFAAAPTQAQSAAQPRLTLEQLRAKYGDRHGKIARIGGVDVYYKDEGHGPVLFMVHGSVSSLKTWDVVAARLIKRYRVIRYDIPPNSLSGPVSDEAAAKLKPTDIAEGLLDQLGVKRVTFVGVSSGGTMGIFLAAKRPDLVERLIIANAPSDPVVTTGLKVSPALDVAQRELRATGYQSRAFWDAFFDFFTGVPARMTPALRDQYYDMNRRTVEKHGIDLVAQVADHEKALAAMARVTAPTLLIWGARDQLLPPAAMDTLAGYLVNAPVSKILLPDVGHYPPLEVPERFAQLIAAYVEAATPELPPGG